MVDASIVIRSKNEARYIGEVLEGLFGQEFCGSFEVVILDSGSRDGTLEIARKFPVAVYSMSPEEFTFGRALNRGAQIAKGEYVIYLSAHCTPVHQQWLERLVEPLEADPGVAATFGRQEPRPEINPFEGMELGWTFPSDHTRDPTVIFSAANCAIRRDAVLRHPFDESVPGAEDYIWRRLLPTAYRVVYVPEASVYHSHPLSFRYWANRFRLHGELIPYLSRFYGMEYYGPPASAPLSGFLKWSWYLARQEYRYCLDNRYAPHLLLIPLLEGFRIFCFWQGLRAGVKGARAV